MEEKVKKNNGLLALGMKNGLDSGVSEHPTVYQLLENAKTLNSANLIVAL